MAMRSKLKIEKVSQTFLDVFGFFSSLPDVICFIVTLQYTLKQQKSVAHRFWCYKMALSEDQLRTAFNLFDADRSGFIDFDEFHLVLKGLNFEKDEDETKELFDKIDTNGQGTIDFDEFSTMVSTQMAKAESKEEIYEAFRAFDTDGSGELTASDLQEVAESIGARVEEDEIQDILKYCGNLEGAIDFDSWSNVMIKMKTGRGDASHYKTQKELDASREEAAEEMRALREMERRDREVRRNNNEQKKLSKEAKAGARKMANESAQGAKEEYERHAREVEVARQARVQREAEEAAQRQAEKKAHRAKILGHTNNMSASGGSSTVVASSKRLVSYGVRGGSLACSSDRPAPVTDWKQYLHQGFTYRNDTCEPAIDKVESAIAATIDTQGSEDEHTRGGVQRAQCVCCKQKVVKKQLVPLSCGQEGEQHKHCQDCLTSLTEKHQEYIMEAIMEATNIVDQLGHLQGLITCTVCHKPAILVKKASKSKQRGSTTKAFSEVEQLSRYVRDNSQVVTIFENQRRALFGDFSEKLLPTDTRGKFSTETGEPQGRETLLDVTGNSFWIINPKVHHYADCDSKGWRYCFNWPSSGVFACNLSWSKTNSNMTFVRQRKWVRTKVNFTEKLLGQCSPLGAGPDVSLHQLVEDNTLSAVLAAKGK
eukprot:gene19890-120_t